MSFIRRHQRGVVLNIFVQPRSSKNSINGLYGDAIKIRLTAPPVDGAANSMCIASEAIGLSLPGNSSLCATDAALERLAEEAGRTVLEHLRSNRRARDVMSEPAFQNMVKVACATSGSTNLAIHFPAIAWILSKR